MKKLLTSLFLQMVFKNVNTTKKLMDIIFDETKSPKVVKTKIVKTPVKFKKEFVINQTEPVNSKKQELMDAIQFLKNKTIKTKVDKDKIQMLEVILKSV
jgi:hypothetical protein